MSLAPQELENSASKYASEAIKFDSQGARGMAIANYQKAIDCLVKLMKLYPNSKLNPIYKERTNSYHNRIKSLQESHGVEPAVDPKATPSEQSKSVKRQESENSFDEMVLKEKPDVSWDEVIGLDDAKNALRESIVYPTKRPDLFPLGWPRGLLLYGPPGCGKTILAAATASEIDGYFINVDASSMMSKWLGEAEKNVSKLFTMARSYADKEGKPVILFVDEVDSLLGSRNSEVGGEIRVRNQFLTEMDGINAKGKDLKMYVVGATNKPWSLDWPFLRRFQKRIYITLPTLEARERLFELYTSPLKKDLKVKISELAKLFDGYSASDIKDVCQGAQLRAVHELFNSPDYQDPADSDNPPQPRDLSMADFKDIMSKRKPSVSMEMIRAYYKWSEEYKAL
ncbi:MAG: AAA family ATPase [Nitrosopumilaceae archaeon]|nr:ATP-binding protein [Nitrosopumilaceae archaeon]NIU00570.1 ATP-binding protein [Nitrosopumilaceae archaeon]NIU86956.1 AAA family ATPase [Nitrosopumilaceae archaeon]NIV66420.1 AAA family ATPase [Nitrosopumilaceae archaeon]NIX61172.1 AAA family ATPase [Nitrosopumilaceae archaeon]